MNYSQIAWDVLTDINLVGCLTMDELFNGSSARRACQPVHVKSLLEQSDIVPEKWVGEHADDYCTIIDIHLHPDTPVLWEQVASLIPVGRRGNRAGIAALRRRYGHLVRK